MTLQKIDQLGMLPCIVSVLHGEIARIDAETFTFLVDGKENSGV
jgi:hypothetical protein